jgi:hypothetical protein
MAIPRKQIGWSQESNLLWEISRQMEKLTGVAYNSGGGGSALIIKNQGTNVTTAATSIDFTGDGVTTTAVGTDVTVNIPGPAYKVYTALLSQTGGDETFAIDTGLLTVGVTYKINNDSPGMDFTNVGAPTNTLYSSFVATGTTPTSWGANEGSGNATLTYNNGAPVVTVLENTIGNIYWTYEGVGVYNANLIGAFNEQKTFALISNPNAAYTSAGTCYSSVTIDFVQLTTLDSTFANSDDLLYLNTIEIRVYY